MIQGILLAILGLTFILDNEPMETPPPRYDTYEIPKSSIELSGSIFSNTQDNFLTALALKTQTPGADKTVYIEIDSQGGHIETGFRIMNMMDQAKKRGFRFVCIVRNYAISMAFTILANCDERYAAPYSILMFHQVRAIVDHPLSPKERQEIRDGLITMNREIDSFLIKSTGLSWNDYYKNSKAETMFRAPDFARLAPGFIDVRLLK